jgi:hypothetical protein
MNLIGGKDNGMHKINGRMIKKTTCWHNGFGKEEVDFLPFSIYDPSLIYDWIIQQRALSKQSRVSGYSITDESVIPGLSADRRYVKISSEEPIFVHRTVSNLFIREFYKKLNDTQ